MGKSKFVFNRETLQFDKVELKFAERIKNFAIRSIFYCFVSVVFYFVYIQFFETPKEQRLKRAQEEILVDYDLLDRKLDALENDLAEIQSRDDYIYRPVFEIPPLSKNIREAGFGGINKYGYLENLENSDVVINSSKRVDILLKKIYVQSKSYDKIIELTKNLDKMISSIPAIQPIAIKDLNRISSYFGYRHDPFTGRGKYHEGMDFTGKVGTDIYATGDGIVVKSNYTSWGYGNVIIVDHGFGYQTRYAHLHERYVKVGQKVKRGDVIGALGNSGRSTGPHLHYEVRRNNIPVNPINFYFNDITSEQYDEMITRSAQEGGNTMD
jgi:murein DD-endopeptidase MepM/ murein hydrolase activator NlpD